MIRSFESRIETVFVWRSLGALLAGLMVCGAAPVRAADIEFSGSVAQASRNFGGSPYCSYRVDLENISQTLELSSDRSAVVRSTISGTHRETGLDNCPFPTPPQAAFQYTMISQSVRGGAVSITFASAARPDIPHGQAVFTGSIDGSSITGTLEFRRTDQAAASLNWSVVTSMRLQLQRPSGLRLVVFLPSDRQVSPTVHDNIKRAAVHLQAWMLRQTGGRTFAIASPEVETCRSRQPASYFFDAPFFRVADELAVCFGWSQPPWEDSSGRNVWAVWAPIRGACGTAFRLGASVRGLSIMGQNDIDGMSGSTLVTGDCGSTSSHALDRWIGGLGHELGHAFGLPHPPGCDLALPDCDSAALMWLGFTTYPSTYLRADEKAMLASSPMFATNGTRLEDRLFNWAESVYPGFFGGRARVMLEFDGYYYREYPDSRNYLAVKGGRVVVYGELTGYRFVDVGAVQDYMPAVAAAGF